MKLSQKLKNLKVGRWGKHEYTDALNIGGGGQSNEKCWLDYLYDTNQHPQPDAYGLMSSDDFNFNHLTLVDKEEINPEYLLECDGQIFFLYENLTPEGGITYYASLFWDDVPVFQTVNGDSSDAFAVEIDGKKYFYIAHSVEQEK